MENKENTDPMDGPKSTENKTPARPWNTTTWRHSRTRTSLVFSAIKRRDSGESTNAQPPGRPDVPGSAAEESDFTEVMRPGGCSGCFGVPPQAPYSEPWVVTFRAPIP